MTNSFVDRLRGEWKFDESEYRELCDALGQLANGLEHRERLDKDLALTLYALPQMVRNAYLHAKDECGGQPSAADRLEEAWIELDALVMECLS